jgi:uncharacterized membrane protein YfcA
VQFKIGLIFAAPSFVGVYFARAFVVPVLPDPVWQFGTFALSKASLVMGVFAILMLLASISMIRPKSSGTNHMGHTKAEPGRLTGSRVGVIALEGLIVGGITGFVGAGGGFLIIPALVVLVGLPMREAVGTSLAIIAVKSLLGFIGDVQAQPKMDYLFLIGISVTSVVGMFLGIRMKSLFSEAFLKKAFGYFVLLMGTVILLDQVLG